MPGWRTLLDTTDPFDAGMAGFDGPTDPDDGGVKVLFSDGGRLGEVEIVACDGRVYGSRLIGMVIDALVSAQTLAKAHERGRNAS